MEWMVSHDFATKPGHGQVVLLSSCLESRTVLSEPEPVQHPGSNDECSLFSLRQKLLRLGWQEAVSRASACVRDKVFRSQSIVKNYYVLLLERRSVWV